MMRKEPTTIAVIGLGYVGLPLAVAFAEHYNVLGYDIDEDRINELRANVDRTLEVPTVELANAKHLEFTTDAAVLSRATVFMITAPTPIDFNKQPDLAPVLSASRTVARALKPGDVVIYESTVYPGATEEECVPVLELESGLTFNNDFGVGYSPERINPGDRVHRLSTVTKVTSGSTPEVADYVDQLYRTIVEAGTHRAPSIRVAEAAKVIENTQRDVNIALMNELAILFGRLGIDTGDVLEAAGSKWNFLNFQPGLVGGHCIGVDPYYLTHKAQAVGYHPEIILAGRRLNDSMGAYVASQLVKRMTKARIPVQSSKVLILGLTFKENTPDLRNSRVIDIVHELGEYDVDVDVHDPWADPDQASELFGIELLGEPDSGKYDAVIVAVGHQQYRDMSPLTIREFGVEDRHVVYDLKQVMAADESDLRL